MKKRKWIWLATSVMAGILLFSGSALAAWNVTGRSTNFITMSSCKNTIIEEYKMPSHVEPGQKVVKKVNIQNEGNSDTFVRVKIEKILGTRGEDESFLADKELDPEMIEVDFNQDYWKKLPDGYWYYTDVLRAGTSTKEPLMKSYRLSERADNRYKNKEAQIVVSMECIQAEGGAMENLWGIEQRELGITYLPCRCETVTKVIFTGDKKLRIEAPDDNLFSSFQNLLPGCGRTQTVKLVNQSKEAISLYLRAEAAEQNRMSEEKLQLVQQLLSKYAVIQVKEGNTVLYQGTVDGNLNGKGWSMKKDISLGTFRAKETKNLVVTLSLDSRMDNQYEELLGKVNWVFTASGGRDTETGSNDPSGSGGNPGQQKAVGTLSPKTGDATSILAELFLMGCGLIGAVFSGWKIYGREKTGCAGKRQ